VGQRRAVLAPLMDGPRPAGLEQPGGRSFNLFAIGSDLAQSGHELS